MVKLAFIFLLLLCLSSSKELKAQERPVTQINYVPKVLAEFIGTISKEISYKEIPDYLLGNPPEFINKVQANEDINCLKYILDYGYCGRYYWGQHGVDFNRLYSDLQKYVKKSKDSVSVRKLENVIIKGLSNLNDGHSKIIGFKTTEFAKSQKAYFAEIVLEKQGAEYIVIQSKAETVFAGDRYLDSEKYLFPTLSAANKKCYLIGTLSFENVMNLKLNFNGDIKSVTLHQCKISKAKNTEKVFDAEKKDNIEYVRVSNLDNRNKDVLKKFSEYGKTARNEKVIIYNLLNIDGGDAIYPRLFTENLNKNARGFDYISTLHSPAVNQAHIPGKNLWLSVSNGVPAEWLVEDVDLNKLPSEVAEIIRDIRKENSELKQKPKKYWEIIKNEIPESGTFKGKFYTIINRRVGSAGINATAFTKSIPNNILIGENTSGGYTFGEVIYYNLEYSKIKLKLPIKIVFHKDFNYERGFLPDYWLDSEEPEKEIAKWINDPVCYQFKYH